MNERVEGVERVEVVTADDGCGLWTVRSGVEDAASPGHGFVFCHGGPGFWDTLGPIARTLEDFGPVVRWDQRGGGRSQWQGPYTFSRFLADLDQVRAHHGLDEVTLLGHSWGASLVLEYALAAEYRSRVRGVVYVAGVGIDALTTWYEEFAANSRAASEPYAAEIAELKAVEARTPEQARRLEQLKLAGDFPDSSRALDLAATQVVEVFDEDPQVTESLYAAAAGYDVARLAEGAKALDVPTLIVDGLSDLRPRWAVDSLAEALPNATRVQLADAGHFPWLDKPEEFEAVLREFVAR
jgi:proline iminopeptidase